MEPVEMRACVHEGRVQLTVVDEDRQRELSVLQMSPSEARQLASILWRLAKDAGLTTPEESPADFARTMDGVNITLGGES